MRLYGIAAMMVVVVSLGAVKSAPARATRLAQATGEAHREDPRAAAPADVRILIGPNVHVSREHEGPLFEPIVAAHPTNPNTLIGSSRQSLLRREERQWIWISRDRGQSWNATYLPFKGPMGDPLVAFGATGTMLVNFTNFPVYRSDDAGKSWTAATQNGKSKEPDWVFWDGDRGNIGIDRSTGKYRGRVYFMSNNLRDNATQSLLRSRDDGRTFEPGVNGTAGRRGFTPLVFSDGVLAIPAELVRLDSNGKPLHMRASNATGRWAMNISADGGDRFTLGAEIPFEGARETCAGHPRWVKVRNKSNTYAVDHSRSSAYANRLYVVQDECRDGVWRSRLTYSADRGKSWSEPRLIAPEVPPGSVQFMPTIAINRDGVVAVTWYDTRHSTRRDGFDLYVTVSTDGGATFLPATRVSSVTSLAEPAGNLRVVSTTGATPRLHDDSVRVYVERGPVGDPRVVGEYMGLAADAQGMFHALWNDSRNGTVHVYAAQIRVLRAGAAASRCDGLADAGEKSSLNNAIRPETDLPVYDSTTATASVPVRLRNVSRDTVCGPLRVTLTPDLGPRDPVTKLLVSKLPPGELTFAEGGALRDNNYLAPGATTEPLWVQAYQRDNTGAVAVGGWLFRVTGPRVARSGR